MRTKKDLQREMKGQTKREKKAETGRRKGEICAVTGIFLLVFSLLLLFAARMSPEFATWYSDHIYKVLVYVVGGFSGLFPVSVSEVLLYIFVIFLGVSVARTVIGAARTKRAAPLMSFFSGVVLAAGILFSIYAAACGVNYYRTSFAEEVSLTVEGGTAEELTEACRILTEQVNETADGVLRDGEGLMILKGDVRGEAVEAMEKLGEEYRCLAGYYPRPKGLLGSWLLSVQKLTGIYSPFTIEANYNTDMTDYNIPFTACHELAHLRGFMQEQEANFIGYMAAVNSDSVQFQYSGALLGWIYCTNALSQVDYEAYQEIRAGLCEEAEKDLDANNRFWRQYDSPVAEVANQVNDAYLKANGQRDGVVSYDRMVEMILAYNRQRS